MRKADLSTCASRNRKVFEKVLEPYVTTKLDRVMSLLPQGARTGWFDASGCVWCLFDDSDFWRTEQGGRNGLQVYWSMGDVVMPAECDPRWVAKRIAKESARQLSARGYRCAEEEREVDGESHLGVRFRKRLLRL